MHENSNTTGATAEPRRGPVRQYRWQPWLTPLRSFLLCATVCVAAQTALLTSTSLPREQWAPAALVAVLTMAQIARVWRTPSAGDAILITLALVAALIMWRAVFENRPPRFPLLEASVAITSVLSLVVGLLVWAGLGPDKVLALVGSLGVALVVGEAALFPKLRPQRAAPPTHDRQAFGARQRTLAANLARKSPSDQLFPIDVWIRGRMWPDKELNNILEPHGMFREYYPDNPFGYFYEDSSAEWAMRQAWKCSEEGNVYLVPTADQGTAVRVEFRRPLRAAQHFPTAHWGLMTFEEGQPVTVRFRGRSDSPRAISFHLQAMSEPFPQITKFHTANLIDAWSDFELSEAAAATHDQVSLLFTSPDDNGSLELADVEVMIGDKPVVPRPWPNLYRHYVSYTLNSQGLRGPEYAVPRPDGVFRIVCVGDSFCFGQGVHEHDTITRVLENRLNQQADALNQPIRFEVINCAVRGYSTRQERILYERYARHYQPQLIVALMVHNDNWDFEEDQHLAVRHAGELETLAAIRNLRSRDFRVCVEELNQFREICKTDGARLATAVFRNAPFPNDGDWDNLVKTVSAGLQGTDVPFIDLGETLLAEHEDVELRVHPSCDYHPSALAHRIAAAALEAFLRREKLVPLAP